MVKGAYGTCAWEEPTKMSVLPDKILLATDGSEDAALATQAAVSISEKSGSGLHLIHAWHNVPSPYAGSFVKRELERQAREILDEQARWIEVEGGKISGIHLRMGRISDEVIQVSEELGARLLVVGSRGHGRVGRILMGSHSEEIVHRTRIPVLVMRRGAVWPPARIVIGDDYSEDAKKAAEMAASLGELFGVREAMLVHAYPHLLEVSPKAGAPDHAVLQAERDLETRAAELEGALGYRPQTKLAAGDAAVAILQTARERDAPATLVAVGSRGLGMGSRVRLGSTSTKVVRATPGPVLVCPHVR
jgi:nucleotide-binding universal stress UspA family protein